MSSFPSLSHESRSFPLPSISEDTLHYVLHLPSSSSESPTALALLITQHVTSLLTTPWLWNKDAWELKVSDSTPSKIEGTMRVGDAIDDEWLVVWLLREISKKWSDLVISVRDTDGEFLLIEAAHALPGWVTPENAHNRLWLYNGHLHLLPLNVRSSGTSRPKQVLDEDADGPRFDTDAWINEEDAIQAVRTGRYFAGDGVEEAVWERIKGYPQALDTHLHRTKAWLPVPVARALHSSPDLIQKAVEGFYVRDPAQLRAAARMNHFPPSPSVLTSVLLTRAAYAQLQGQKFHPPRVFGPEWTPREGADAGEMKWRDLGVKIATGFEIMYREGGRRGKSGTIDDDALSKDPAYEKYLQDLTRAGFFGTELRGSEQWQARERKAKDGWKAARAADVSAQRPSFAYLVDQAIEAVAVIPLTDIEVSPATPEDSDSWLEVSPDELDAMMLRASGQAQRSTDDTQEAKKLELGEEHGRALRELAHKVESFVGGQGDIEGARFADELSDDEMESEESEEEITAEERERRLNELVPDLPADEWGSKTQTTTKIDVTMNDSDVKKELKKATPLKMRPPIFPKDKFDGVDSSDSDSDSEDLPVKGSAGWIIAQKKWAESAPKIETLDEDEEDRGNLVLGDDIDDEMIRNLERDQGLQGDEADVDMEAEQDEFLAFAREALGITDDAWENILSERRERGAFVPVPKVNKIINEKRENNVAVEKGKGKENREMDMTLDSFDKVMNAMEEELARATGNGVKGKATGDKGKEKKDKDKDKSVQFQMPLPTEDDIDNMSEGELEAMDRELRAALRRAGEDSEEDDLEDIPELGQLDEDDKREFKMMRDFLESYTSQAGGSGVVGNLFGRLGH
ncbi:hypothetical protein TREMEDRAFT_44967 [Tremella mesenterica DSM 1558]|uniref:uncharacterized protein n=1 Tax=Tremella mesenterica (strain ATCC 24925 / CBS 8224 / DSM 1558 / NBRC 9311 / NRRL Y-6157 / RJB 2259-6 / UBC 559-6) TaxID=578456 RepID=UPI0003F4A139|nr:uncharacterized protein TREMEDRAFT_44967 [Tremella mesenterica DSM 1558]EIW67973.1 hypothetical protein TREMEDRAFT_44967 [Tremella mesenterica DSM 1558]